MGLIQSINGSTRRIYLSSETVGQSIHPIDIYKEYRTLRRTNESLRKYSSFMRADGNVIKGGGKFTERYVTLLEGTKIVPYNVSHTLTITGTIITDDGQEGVFAFDRAPLSVNIFVDINYIPPQVEVIKVETGISGLTPTESQKLDYIEIVKKHY